MWQPKLFTYVALALVPYMASAAKPKEGIYCSVAQSVPSPSGRVNIKGNLCFEVNDGPLTDLYLNISKAWWKDGESEGPPDEKNPLMADIKTIIDEKESFGLMFDKTTSAFIAPIDQISGFQAGLHNISIKYTQHGPKFLEANDTLSFSGTVDIDVPAAEE